jgi:signal transduction histidine kinase
MVKSASAFLSKARRTHVTPRYAIRQPPRDPSPPVDYDGAPAMDGHVPGVLPSARGHGNLQPGAGPTSRAATRRALKNWRVRSRLLLLVVIPTVTAVAAGGIFIASSVQSAFVYDRVLTLANLSGKITGLVQALQNEREDTIRFIVLGSGDGGRGASPSSTTPPAPELALLDQDYAATTSWANQVKALAGGINGSYSALAQQDTQAALTAIGNLPAIRVSATGSQLPALNVIEEYASTINTLLAVESQIAIGSSDSTLAGSVSVLGLVSSMKEQASQEQALLTSALRSDLVSLGQFGPDQQSAITDAQAQQQGDLNQFDTAATAAQRQVFNNALSTLTVVQAQAEEQQAISLASSGSPIATDPTISDASSALLYVVAGMRSVEQQFAASVISRSSSLHGEAITAAIVYSLAVALLLGIALTATTVVGRSMVGPLRRLRNGALQVAETRLPEMVRRMSETDGQDVSLKIEPIDVDSLDEIGQVARAFDQVHKEAVRLAANEAALRGNVNAMFVNLSRRTQSLVERQIRVITRLEQSEQDSERLANLFQIDHLATRMRRNSENLLVLAGHELSRRWGRPVAIVDVLRAAVSEIEQYERVTLNVQAGISIRREAVRDMVHLTAELVENATSFSADDTPVTIAAFVLSSGGVLIEITDQGVGMKAEQIANANWRLDNPPTVDVAVSRRMGLFVVARLAARHGIRVRLRPAQTRGLSALVWLPNEAITPENGSAGPLRSGAAASGNRVAGSMADFMGSSSETGNVTPLWEGGHYAGIGMDGIAPPPRPTPPREELGMADSDQYLVAEEPAWDTEPWDTTGPLPRIRGQMRAAELGAGSGLRDAAPAQGGGDQRARALAATADALSDAGSGQYLSAVRGTASWPDGTLPRTVVVPPAAESVADRDRLPIFEAVESAWFRRGLRAVSRSDESSASWSSPADDGWQAAEVVYKPTADGTTRAGLPKRAPGANLVPGTAAAPSASGPASATSPRSAPGRSAAQNRDRLAGYQRGIRQARTAATGGNPGSGTGPVS